MKADLEKINKERWKTFGEKFENVNTLIPKADTYQEETNKQMDEGFKSLDETLDSTSESIIVSPKTEESSKKTEIREDQKACLLYTSRCV